MRRLLASAAFATLLAFGAAATTAAAMPRMPLVAEAPVVTRIADLDRPAAVKHRRKARLHRHRHAHWRDRGVVVTSGHPLHRFPGEIVYTCTVPDCWRCGPRAW